MNSCEWSVTVACQLPPKRQLFIPSYSIFEHIAYLVAEDEKYSLLNLQEVRISPYLLNWKTINQNICWWVNPPFFSGVINLNEQVRVLFIFYNTISWIWYLFQRMSNLGRFHNTVRDSLVNHHHQSTHHKDAAVITTVVKCSSCLLDVETSLSP